MGNLIHYMGGGGGSGSGSLQNGVAHDSPGDTPDHPSAGSGAADGYASEDFVAGSSSRRERKKGVHRTYRIRLLLILLLGSVFFIYSRTLNSYPLLPLLQDSRNLPPICADALGEKFMWYSPHSGVSNQISEFKNAILMAAILNRTLIVPPVLDHHAVALGSCPKFRVLEPNELRFRVWNHSIELLREGRYVSIADIMDLSSLVSSSAVRLIDFRVFVSVWCGVSPNLTCGAVSNKNAFLLKKLEHCGSLLSGFDGNINSCLFGTQEDCRTTVWTYQTSDGVLDSYQADDALKRKRKFSYLRYRKDVYRALGPSSVAGPAAVLAFGSLFTAPYVGSQSHIDIHEPLTDQRINMLIQKIEFVPFISEILDAGKNFALHTIRAPFLCTQLRLLDGQFKNHRRATFLGLKNKLELLKQNGSLPINIFVMTDLPLLNWTGSYLGNLAKDSPAFKLFFLREEDELVTHTAKKVVNAEHAMKLQSITRNLDWREHQCESLSLPDVLLFLEQTVCSCASLGFVGTSGSTIAESIELMRKYKICSR